jgi:hypothetical protein
MRLSQSVRVGPFRFRVSAPLGRGRTWVSAGTRTGRRSWTSVSAPLGGRRRRSR